MSECNHAHDHDHADVEDDVGVSLHQYIDIDRVTCLNETVAGSGRAILKTHDERLSAAPPYLTSPEGDPELLLFVPFTEAVSIQSFCMQNSTLDTTDTTTCSSYDNINYSSAKHVRLFTDRVSLDFDEARELDAQQQLDLVPPEHFEEGTIDYPCRPAGRFQNISSITLFIVDNFDNNSDDPAPTKITYIGFKGKGTKMKRQAVEAVYETRGMMKDHKVPGAELGSGSIQKYLSRALRETGNALKLKGEVEIFSRHRPSMVFRGVRPFKTNDTFIAPTASVVGDVTNWDKSSVWYKAVVRANPPHTITIGFSSSVGEGTVVTTLNSSGELENGLPADAYIGHYVTIGSGCVLTSCRVDDLSVVGDKCTILEGALVEHHVILESGTVVAPYARIPSGQKWAGNPATYVADLTTDEIESIKELANKRYDVAEEHLIEFLPYGYSYVHLEDLANAARVKTSSSSTN